MAALSEIEKLEARWAENPDGRYFAPLADAYRKAGRLDDALMVVTGGLGKHPDYLSAHIVYGRILLEKKDEPAAQAAFQKVLSLDAENIIALKSLAEIAERTGDNTGARRWLQRLVNVDAMNQEAADDLNRLGGPLPDESQEDGGAAEAAPAISFMDLEAPAVPEAPATEEPVVPRTLERAAVKWPPPAPEPAPAQAAAAATPTLEIEPTAVGTPPSPQEAEAAPPLQLEHASFQSPSDAPSVAPGDVVPFDDQLAWGAGERRSRAVNAEDAAAAEQKSDLTPAIEFMGAEQPPGRASHEGPPPAGVAAAIDSSLPTLPLEGIAPPKGWSGVQMSSESPTIEMPPVRAGQPAEEPAAMTPPPAEAEASGGGTNAAHDLPLIMPEDVTPAEEMRRPSTKLVQMVSPEPPAGDASGEPMVTETMGDLYLKQGFKDQAADVYRRLLAARPGDAGLQAKLANIQSPPAMSAKALGQEAVGAWLKRIAKAQLGAKAPSAPAPPEPGPTPMEQAFSSGEPEAAPSAPAPVPVNETAQSGAPARPATDQYSLDQLFGGGQQPQQGGQRRSAAPREPSGTHTLGASFDEFFGSAPKQETVRPTKEGSAPGGRQSEDDLSAFNAWLHGLKR